MREGWPSVTAAIVALGRGVGVDDERRDERAHTFAPAPLGRVLEGFEGRPLLRGVARVASVGLVDHATLRMAAIDDAVSAAVAAGCSQLVILGAGMDARAWRMSVLSEVDVLEVDHPSTQARKRERAGGLDVLSRRHTFVPVDFERDRLGERLAAAEHDATRPTVWVWEGVTMYLQPEAMEATIGEIAARSAPGSELVVTYVTPEVMSPWTISFASTVFAVLGEPLHGFIAPEILAERLALVGLDLVEDTSSVDWARRYGTSTVLPAIWRQERLARAVRRT